MSSATARVMTSLRHVVARVPLLASGARVVVGFSGGQDSTALLHALAHLPRRRRPALQLVAVYVDHGIRPASAAEAEHAVALARSMGVEAFARRVDVPAYRARWRRSTLQQAARAARYWALASVAAERGTDLVAVAHTADDQAETLLLNLLRGAGLDGLAGMRAVERLRPADLGPPIEEVGPPPPAITVLRPLLPVERQATAAYCRDHGLPVVEDPTNRSAAYTRNRLRRELLPLLEAFNPAVRQVLARTADLAAEDAEALDRHAREVEERVLATAPDGSLEYPLSDWHALARAVRRRLLRRGVLRLTGGLADLAAAPVDDALDFAVRTGERRARYNLARGVDLECDRHTLRLRRRAPEPIGESPGMADV